MHHFYSKRRQKPKNPIFDKILEFFLKMIIFLKISVSPEDRGPKTAIVIARNMEKIYFALF